MTDVIAQLRNLSKKQRERESRVLTLTETIQKCQKELETEQKASADTTSEKQQIYINHLAETYESLLNAYSREALKKSPVFDEAVQKADKELLASENDMRTVEKYAPAIAAAIKEKIEEAKKREKQRQEIKQTLEQKLTINILAESDEHYLTLYLPIPHAKPEEPAPVRNFTSYLLETLILASDAEELVFDAEKPFSPYDSFSKLTVLTSEPEKYLARIKRNMPDGFDDKHIHINIVQINSIDDNIIHCMTKNHPAREKKTEVSDNKQSIYVRITKNQISRHSLPYGRREFWPDTEIVQPLLYKDGWYSCMPPNKRNLRHTQVWCAPLFDKLIEDGLEAGDNVRYEITGETRESQGRTLALIRVHLEKKQ